jgi:Na+-driven multidrug efflux pump
MSASMTALFLGTLGQIVSAIIVGNRLESAALSVMAVALPVQFLFSMSGALLGVGGTAVCARSIGKGRFEECHRAFTLTYLLLVLIAALFASILFVFIDPLVRFLGAGPEIFENTKRYVTILIAGGVCSMSIYPAFNLLRLDGRSGSSVLVFFSMALVNVLLGVALLFGLRIGVEAAAIAAVASSAVSGGFGAALLFTRSRNFRFILPGFTKKAGRRDYGFEIARDIFILGSPSAMEYLCNLTCVIALNKLIAGSFGLSALSSFKLIDSLKSFALIFIFGAAGPIIQFVGVFDTEKDSKSIRQLLAQVFKWGVLFVFVYVALCEVFAPNIAVLFGMASPETLAAAVPAIRIFAASLVLALINIVLVCVYQAGGMPLLANIITLSRLLIWIVITAPLLSARIGVTGIWYSFPVAESLALFTAVMLSLFYRRKNKYLSPVLLINTEAEKKGIYKSFSVRNIPESITQSSEGITEFCEQNSMSPKLTMAISLAIEEMLVVIREYSLPGIDDAVMNVRVLIADRMVILRIRNGGRAFNPVEHAEKAGEDKKMDLMGIKIIMTMAEKIDYRNTFGINNTTVLLKRQETA